MCFEFPRSEQRCSHIGASAALLIAVFCFTSDVTAQAGALDDYRQAVELGLQEYDAHNYLEARAQFLRAHTFAPSARTERALGNTAFALRNYPESIRWLEAALNNPVKPLDDKLRAESATLLRSARAYVDSVRLRVNPNTAAVAVDGRSIPAAANSGPLLLGVGEHLLELNAPGKQPLRRTIVVRGGDTRELEANLIAAPSRGPRHASWFQNPWFWTAVGVAVCGAVAGGALAAGSRDSEARSLPVQGGSTGVVLMAAP